ncbi:hypothetical protein PLESTM_001461500 [Pleodorina starrii]|nr:hypothetical protein PLESTM_001461500 [Pleodorina starrii]
MCNAQASTAPPRPPVQPSGPSLKDEPGPEPIVYKACPKDTAAGGTTLRLNQRKEQRAAAERKIKLTARRLELMKMHRPGHLPSGGYVPPKLVHLPIKIPAPFSLSTEARGQQYLQEQKRLHGELERAARDARYQFSARPVLKNSPKLPSFGAVPLTVPNEVELHTSARAVGRSLFDSRIKDKEAAAKARAEEEKLEAARLEEAVVRHYRKTVTAFRANPMPDFTLVPPAAPKTKPKEVTKARSPNLLTSKRRKVV